MTNIRVCILFVAFFCCGDLSVARQTPKECSKGPDYWCQNLKQAADCGAVGHCISTVWENQNVEINKNEVSNKFVRLFKQLKDVKELINAEYLDIRVTAACKDVSYPAIASYCRQNTGHLQNYLLHVLQSNSTAETMCTLIGMCNNKKLDNFMALRGKKTPPSTSSHHIPGRILVGHNRCTWGPSYWCNNISTSHECMSTHHCIERVWLHKKFEEDTDDICKICKDMVQQARDQLQSNETQEDLKAVFEGSCKLIPVKVVAEECIKLADDFVPELVETLASQMNPTAVCSVAGLCNSPKIDRLLEDYNAHMKLRAGCTNCHKTVGVMRKKFDSTTYEDFLHGLLTACRDTGSLSDSCSMLVFKYYEKIVAAVKKDLTPQSVCHVSGQCSYMFHSHGEYNYPVEDAFSATDDVPCEFCEQLITHLRDVLTANTTEMQFYKVLTGLCKQTGDFKDECLHLVDEYYKTFYSFLVNDLNPNELCSMIGLCGKPKDVPIAPLLSPGLGAKAVTVSSKVIGADDATSPKPLGRVSLQKQTNVRIMSSEPVAAPLPIERMFVALPQNKVTCSFCQYFLHYVQCELSDIKTEEQIKIIINKACDALPKSVNGECKQFVTQYADAVIALLVQEIDPSLICPKIGLCPEEVKEVRNVDINSEKSNCPLCLFAVEQLETILENNRTEANIRNALKTLCNELSQKMKTQCADFVNAYSDKLVEMLVANMNAQEICVFLKLCTDKKPDPLKITRPTTIDSFHEKPHLRGDMNRFRGKSLLPKRMLQGSDGDIETNEIPDDTVNGRTVKPQASADTVCVLCEFVMKEIDDQIKDKNNEDEIKKIVHGICQKMPKSLSSECNDFVNKYADVVISLLVHEMDPAHICLQMKLCKASLKEISMVKGDVLDCAVCETVVLAVKKVLSNEKVDKDIVQIAEKACGLLPAKYSDRCYNMMDKYGYSIINLIEEFGVKGICDKIGMCSEQSANYVHMRRVNAKALP